MANQQLLDYIKQQLNEDISKEEIKKTLTKSGWTNDDIDGVFSSLAPQPEVQQQTKAPIPETIKPTGKTINKTSTPPTAISSPTLFAGVGTLMSRSWNIYKNRFWTLIGISSIPVIFLVLYITLIVFITSLFGNLPKIMVLPLVVLFSIIFIAVSIWSILSLLFAINDPSSNISESFRKSWKKILSYLWIIILFIFITIGGLALFIIPAILFAVWFSLYQYTFISEDIKGMDALMKSKEYVKGKWWGVFGRTLAFIIPLLIFYAIINNIIILLGFPQGSDMYKSIHNIYTLFINIFILPFTLIYYFSMYQSLKEVRGSFVFEPKGKGKFIAIGILGVISIPFIFILSSNILINLNNAREKGLNSLRVAQLSDLNIGINKFYSTNKKLPTSLEQLVPKYVKKDETLDPLTKKPYKYSLEQNNSYKICTVLKSVDKKSINKKYCLGSANISTQNTLENKTAKQKKTKKEFIDTTINKFGTRKAGFTYYFDKGNEAMKYKNTDLAIENVKKALLLDPQNPNAYLALGIIAGYKDNTDTAISYFKEGLKYDKANANLHCNMAVIYFMKSSGETDKALKTNYLNTSKIELEKGLKSKPSNTICLKIQKATQTPK